LEKRSKFKVQSSKVQSNDRVAEPLWLSVSLINNKGFEGSRERKAFKVQGSKFKGLRVQRFNQTITEPVLQGSAMNPGWARCPAYEIKIYEDEELLFT
jgi:hypothetical protein